MENLVGTKKAMLEFHQKNKYQKHRHLAKRAMRGLKRYDTTLLEQEEKDVEEVHIV